MAWNAFEPRRTSVDLAEGWILDPVLQFYVSDAEELAQYRTVVCRLVEELQDPTQNAPHQSFYPWSIYVQGSVGWHDKSLEECLEQIGPSPAHGQGKAS